MKSIELFLPHLLPQCPGVADPTAKQALRSAAIDFCNRSQLIQEISTQTATAGQEDYDVDVPAQTTLVRLLQVSYQTTPLTLVASARVVEPLALRGSVGSATPAAGTPQFAFFKTPSGGTFTVYPVPNITTVNILTIRAAFAPTRTASQFDDLLYELWLEPIVAGAVAILQAQAGQSYSNTSAAVMNKMIFERAVGMARVEAHKGRVVSSTRVRPVFFG